MFYHVTIFFFFFFFQAEDGIRDLTVTGVQTCALPISAGHFNADVRLAGTAGMPQLSGAVKVSDGEIDVYQVNLALRQVQLDARLSDAGLDFNGGAHAGAGSVTVGGHLEWRQLLPYGKLHLQGTNLRVA